MASSSRVRKPLLLLCDGLLDSSSGMKQDLNLLNRQFTIRYHFALIGARGSAVVKALCYKPEGRGFHTR
jgi:hypothetical protein